MTDSIYRQSAIDVIRKCNAKEVTPAYMLIDKAEAITELMMLPSAQPDLTHIIFETLAECGIYGEEATVKFVGILKRLGRSDLLPPCAR